MCLPSPAMVVEVMGLLRSQVRRNLMGRWEGGLHPLYKVTAEAVERESACGPRIQGLDHSGLQASLQLPSLSKDQENLSLRQTTRTAHSSHIH